MQVVFSLTSVWVAFITPYRHCFPNRQLMRWQGLAILIRTGFFFQGFNDNRLGFVQNATQMIRALKAFGINLVDVFGSGGTCRKPAALGHHFQTADGSAIARRVREQSQDFFTGQFRRLDLRR